MSPNEHIWNVQSGAQEAPALQQTATDWPVKTICAYASLSMDMLFSHYFTLKYSHVYEHHNVT